MWRHIIGMLLASDVYGNNFGMLAYYIHNNRVDMCDIWLGMVWMNAISPYPSHHDCPIITSKAWETYLFRIAVQAISLDQFLVKASQTSHGWAYWYCYIRRRAGMNAKHRSKRHRIMFDNNLARVSCSFSRKFYYLDHLNFCQIVASQ